MKKHKIILSCTSTANRLNLFYYTHMSLLNQTIKPDLILLNISKEHYLQDPGCCEIPDWLAGCKIQVNFVRNTGSYRKLLPSLEFAGDRDYLITVDDDVIYSSNLVKELVESADLFPDHIICSRARILKKNFLGKWQNYLSWPVAANKRTGLDLLPIGTGGILYRKSLLDLEFISDESFIKIAPTTDDLWFKFASLRCKTEVAVFPEIEKNNVYLNHGFSLNSYNNCPNAENRPLFLLLTKFRVLILNYLGINQTPNDFAWDRITKASQRMTGVIK